MSIAFRAFAVRSTPSQSMTVAEKISKLVESEIRTSTALHLAEFKRPNMSNDRTFGAA
jgi:hypothetical protein